jgi:hypothetical protein
MRKLIAAASVSLALVALAAPSIPASADDNPPNTCFGQPSPWVKLNGADYAKGTGYVVQNVMVEIDYPNGNGETHVSVNVQPDGGIRVLADRASNGGSTGFGTVTLTVFKANDASVTLCGPATVQLVAS